MSRAAALLMTALLAAAMLVPGCASTKAPLKMGAPDAPLSAERKAEVLASFEAQRDSAQLQSALNRWKEGNAAACERALKVLVERRPAFVDARVQYAELMLSQNNISAAQAQLQEALRLAPDRADVHHSLAVVLEADGRTADAAEHFRRAADLEPDSPLYQFAVEGLQEVRQ